METFPLHVHYHIFNQFFVVGGVLPWHTVN